MTAGPTGTVSPPVKSRSRNRSLLRELPVLLVVALVIATIVKTFVVQAFVIPSGSMQDTLDVGDKILVNKLVYHFRSIKPGDVIVFDGTGSWQAAPQPTGTAPALPARVYDDTLRKLFDAVGSLFGSPLDQTDFVKRVIGVPGDHVACCNAQGLVTVNGVPLHEQSYLYPGNKPSNAPGGVPGRFNVRVPAGYVWVLGDHRAISADSRAHEADPGNGMIPEDKVIGRAFMIAWPPSRWRILPIPATFDQRGIDAPRSAAAAAAGYLPAAAGVTGAVPLAWLYRRRRTRPGLRSLRAKEARENGRLRGRDRLWLMSDEQASQDRVADDLGSPRLGAADARPSVASSVPAPPSVASSVPAQPPEGEAAQPPGGPVRQRPSRRERRSSAWRELPILIVVALAIALLIKTFVVQPFFIPSSSMEDTLLIGDKVLVNKLVYHFRGIDRGDVIVFSGAGSWNAAARPTAPPANPIARGYDDTLRKLFDAIGGLFGTPADEGPDYIKRVIGLPGDHVACCNAQGLVTVNGVPLHESSYLYPGAAPSLIHFSLTVPPGRLWVMGDNRQISDDSRMRQYDPGHGTIPENEVIGRAFVIVWPPSRWRTLPIPATFAQPALTRAGAAAAAAVPYAPLAAGVVAGVPLTWLQRRTRRSVRKRLRARRGNLPR